MPVKKMGSNIWIGIEPNLLLKGFDTRALFQCDHYLQLKMEPGNYGGRENIEQVIDNDKEETSNGSSNNYDFDIPVHVPKEEIKQTIKQKRMKDQSKMDDSIKCNQCKKKFRFRNSLLRHKRIANCVEKGDDYVRPCLLPRVCPECGKTVKGAKSMRDHIKSVHLKIKVFKHQCCGHGFSNRSNLTSHIEKVHIRETFFCEHCPRGFTSSVYLRDHTRRQHSETAVECPNCKKKFIQRRNLDIHIQTEICGEDHIKFNKEKQLSKKVNCPHCSVGFATNTRLKRHINNVHLKGTGVSPLGRTKICEYCDFQTPFNKKLNTHIKTIHTTGLL